ncbi:hypothetical protein C7E17_25435, partial [Stenotrophomonas maltophilia]
RLELPLVPIQANGFDLMEALARARRIAGRIGLVTHASDVVIAGGSNAAWLRSGWSCRWCRSRPTAST